MEVRGALDGDWRLLEERPDGFVIENRRGVMTVARRGLSPEMVARIRASASVVPRFAPATGSHGFRPFRIVRETPELFVLQTSDGNTTVPKHGLSADFQARIRTWGERFAVDPVAAPQPQRHTAGLGMTGGFLPFRLLQETPELLVLERAGTRIRVPKRGLSPAFIDRIRTAALSFEGSREPVQRFSGTEGHVVQALDTSAPGEVVAPADDWMLSPTPKQRAPEASYATNAPSEATEPVTPPTPRAVEPAGPPQSAPGPTAASAAAAPTGALPTGTKSETGTERADDSALGGIPEQVPGLLDSLVDGVGELQRIHYGRNVFNKYVPYEEATDQKAKEPWIKMSESMSRYHHFGAGRNNEKFVASDGHSENVYRNHVQETDPANIATYNFVSPLGVTNWPGHYLFDIAPYWAWGNTPDDPTPFPERVLGPFDPLSYLRARTFRAGPFGR